MSKTDSLFQRLRAVNTSDIMSKNYAGLNYISWGDAWARLKENFPDASYHEHEFDEANTTNKVPYLRTPIGTWVRVTVTIEGTSQTESLPVMDNKMNAMENPNARDVNDNLKRCLVKCLALMGFGLGAYEKTEEVNAGNPNSHTVVDHLALKSSPLNKGMSTEYRIPFGKHKGKSFADLGAKEVGNYKNYLERDALAQGKKLFGQALELVKAADLYLALSSVNEEPPPFDESLPF